MKRGVLTADDLRRALIRLLWREVADGGGCVCEEDAVPASGAVSWDRTLTDTCQAMRALGWGRHWDAVAFQRKAMSVDAAEPPTDSKELK